jgi:hypothetical protein
MANLRLTYSDIYTHVSNFLGLTVTGTAPTGTDLTTCKDICMRGLRQFLYPIDARTGDYWEWSFLRPFHTMVLLDGTWRYQLPEDFSSIITNPTYEEDGGFKQIAKTTPDNITNLMAGGAVDYAPYYYSIVTSDFDPEIGEFDEIWFYPKPDSTYRIQFFYKSDPTKTTEATEFLPGGVKSTEAILENCLAVAESQEDDVLGIHIQLAKKLTQELIIIDSKKDADNMLIGNLYDSKNGESVARSDRATFTVYGTELT